MERIPFEQLRAEFERVLLEAGVPGPKADRTAALFAENTRDGVYSHGLNRFSGFVDGIRSGKVDPDVEPTRVRALGALEQWDGNRGIGLINAEFAMNRAIELARENAMGCVGLRNTNHWMRPGAFGLQAAEAACIGICWTNTTVLMPPWGSATRRIGNNPMVICIPRKDGPVLLDMAMSQYSNGKLEVMQRRGEALPLAGGYDTDGNLTTEPGAILDSRRALPIGYWKGSGLALVLDILASVISDGDSTHEIGARPHETAVSQVYIAIDTSKLGDNADAKIDAIVTDFLGASPLEGVDSVRYPGEGMLAIRRDSLANGIPVDPDLWLQLQSL